jgi:hypothetical protein
VRALLGEGGDGMSAMEVKGAKPLCEDCRMARAEGYPVKNVTGWFCDPATNVRHNHLMAEYQVSDRRYSKPSSVGRKGI